MVAHASPLKAKVYELYPPIWKLQFSSARKYIRPPPLTRWLIYCNASILFEKKADLAQQSLPNWPIIYNLAPFIQIRVYLLFIILSRLGPHYCTPLPVLEENVEDVHYRECSSIFFSIDKICDIDVVENWTVKYRWYLQQETWQNVIYRCGIW